MERAGETIPVYRFRRLRRTELPVDTVELARYLIGKIVVHETDDGRLSGRIVETEAYPVGDSAGHAFRGETPGNRSLFLGRGHAHVYFIYGSSFMLNVTTEVAGVGAGALLRALEPLEGIDRMQRLRGGAGLLDLARGPGRLTEAMEIDFRQDGLDLCAAGPLWLATSWLSSNRARPDRTAEPGTVAEGFDSAGRAVRALSSNRARPDRTAEPGTVAERPDLAGRAVRARKTGAIGESVRIGLTRNVDRKWRFFERGNPYVSGPKRLSA